MSAPRFITVHDATASKRQWPLGRPVRVRADAIDTLRPYPEGTTRTVLGIHGVYLHVTENESQILRLLGTWVDE